MIRLAYYTDSRFRSHDMGAGHPECPERTERIHDRLRLLGLLDFLDALPFQTASDEQLLRAHSSEHLASLESHAPEHGIVSVDGDTVLVPGTLAAARLAAGSGIAAVDTILAGQHERAFCNVRPPGHHAGRNGASGFCFFNNVAVAVRHALQSDKVRRVVLVDFDVHHGNGSEEILAGDERVLMLSTFQRGLYPHTGERALADNIVSVPLPPYSGGEAMREAVLTRWAPALAGFEPDMFFVSAGFDAHRSDDLGQLGWTDADFAWLTRWVVQAAQQHAQGRIVSMLEGGYNLPALARSVEQHIMEMLEINLI